MPRAGATSPPLPIPPGPHSQQKIQHGLIHSPWFPHDNWMIKAFLHGGSEMGQSETAREEARVTAPESVSHFAERLVQAQHCRAQGGTC